MNEKSRKTIKELITLFIMILVAYALTEGIQIAAKHALNVDMPFVVVASNSMSPTLNVGDLLIIQGVNPKELKVGDIIIFKPPNPYWKGIPWVHRIVEIKNIGNELRFRTKGDANIYPDPFWISHKNIIGKVLYKIPYIGLVSLTLKNWTIPIIVLLIIIGIAYTLINKETEEMK